jgi:hypothetical protein
VPRFTFKSVRTKILAAFGLVCLIAVVVGGLTVTRVNNVATTTERIQQDDVIPLAAVGKLNGALWKTSSNGILAIFSPASRPRRTPTPPRPSWPPQWPRSTPCRR